MTIDERTLSHVIELVARRD